MSRTYGPRFSNGYQFPRTSGARLTRGQPIQHVALARGSVEIAPLDGGRTRKFDVTAFFEETPGVWVRTSYIATDELEAKAELHRIARRLAQ